MNAADILSGAVAWLNDPLNWTNQGGILSLGAEHLVMTVLAVAAAGAVALPLGVILGHVGRGGAVTVFIGNASRAVPTLALLTLFATTALGFGNAATVVAVAIFAVPPMLTNSYTALRDVDPHVKEAATGMGLGQVRRLLTVELPLALPLIGAGIRTAAVQTIATIPLAALVGGGGLGVIVSTGFATQHYERALAGAVLIVVLCLALEGALAIGQRVLTPRPLRSGSVRRRNSAENSGVTKRRVLA